MKEVFFDCDVFERIMAVLNKRDPLTCVECGQVGETCPFGVDYAEVCEPCALKDMDRTDQNIVSIVLSVQLGQHVKFLGEIQPTQNPELN